MQRVHQFNAFRTLICLTGLLTLLTTRVGFAQQIASEDWAFGYEAFNLLLQESDIEICNRGEWSFTPVLSDVLAWRKLHSKVSAIIRSS